MPRHPADGHHHQRFTANGRLKIQHALLSIMVLIAINTASLLLNRDIFGFWWIEIKILVIGVTATFIIGYLALGPVFRVSTLFLLVLYIVLIIEWFASCYRYFGLYDHTYTLVHSGLISIYFSTITFTTLGYGDFVPANAAGRALAATESLIGYVFLGLLIARAVNVSRSR